MKLNFLVLLLLGGLASFSPAVIADDGFEEIESELLDRSVVMQLPEGVRRIRMQVRDDAGLWVTHTIAHLNGGEGFLKLRLPDGVSEDDIEIAASWSDPFPFEFYAGGSKFDPTQSDGSNDRTGAPELSGGITDDSESATVEESDIWKWRDSTLYFFNQYRGLQVVDVSDPAKPVRLATKRLPFGGEQLYLHPTDNVVVLLTYDSNTGNGQVVLVEHTETDELDEIAAIPVPGYIVESRMVGSILYVVSRRWWQESTVDPDSGVEHLNYKSGLAVSKIDLTDPKNPVTADALELNSDRHNYWGGEVQATAEALLVSTSEYDPGSRRTLSTVHVVDISDPSLDPVLTHEVPIKGHVLNKFNMNLQGDILTVVSQVRRGVNLRMPFASVETFDISEPNPESDIVLIDTPDHWHALPMIEAVQIRAVGELEFANNETITATRFAGDLLYVVTVLRIDPLFVISLEDPANPKLLGELEVPGFSTHMEVLGEESIISVGVEGSQVAVSWFDVSTPEEPSLSSRVYIGAEDGWSWTEANWDEKAFGFFPNDQLILLPYQGSVPDVGWVSGVQIIEMGENELIKRGSFEHEFQARRARVLGDAVVSISGRSLKSLDVTDLDNPVLLADLTLAWPVDYVHRVGDYLVQLERGPNYWYYGSNDASAKLHVSAVADTDELETSMDLPVGMIVGSVLINDCLIVAQSSVEEDETYGSRDAFSTTIIDLSDPQVPTILGSATDIDTSESYFYGYGSEYRGELLPDGSLVWYPGEQNYNYFFDRGIGGGLEGGDSIVGFGYPYYSSSGKVYTVSITNKEQPQILSAFDLNVDGLETGGIENLWPEGDTRILDSVLYFGLQSSSYVDLEDGKSQWMGRHWLGQVDLNDSASPQKRELVEIPGSFENVVSNDDTGIFLFSSTFQSIFENDLWKPEFKVQALAFDGLEAFLVDELVDLDQGYGPRLFSDQFVVLGKTDYSSNEPISSLTTYEWLSSGSFLKHQTLEHPGGMYSFDVKNGLLVVPSSGNLSFIDFFDPTAADPTRVTFPNIYYRQSIDLIDIFEREIAYLPNGWYGVQALDFDGVFTIEESIELPTAQADPAQEWIGIDLDVFTKTAASNHLLLGELAEDEPWMYTESADQMSYETWTRQALNLGVNDPVPSSEEDIDGDGLSNGLEFFAGSHPGNKLDTIPVESWISSDTEDSRFLHLRFAANPHASDSMVITPQYSTNLNDWVTFPDAFEEIEEPFNPEKLLRYVEPISSNENLFFRLVLSTE